MKTAALIRAQLKNGPRTRAEIAGALSLRRQQVASHLHKQLLAGLLVEAAGEDGVLRLSLGRLARQEDTVGSALRLRARKDRGNAAKKARRQALAALKPKRVFLTDEEKLARRRAQEAKRAARISAERALKPPKPLLTEAERIERRRESSRRYYAKHHALLNAKRARKPKPAAVAPQVLRTTQRKPGPAIQNCAKRRPAQAQVVLPQTTHLSSDDLRAMLGDRFVQLPGPTPLAYRAQPVGAMWRGAGRAAA